MQRTLTMEKKRKNYAECCTGLPRYLTLTMALDITNAHVIIEPHVIKEDTCRTGSPSNFFPALANLLALVLSRANCSSSAACLRCANSSRLITSPLP